MGGLNLFGFLRNDGVGRWDYLGLYVCDGMSKEDCDKQLEAAKKDARVQGLMKLIKDLDCSVSFRCTKCCWEDNDTLSERHKNWGAFHQFSPRKKHSRISMCFCNQGSKNRKQEGRWGATAQLLHELVHAADACYSGQANTCDKVVCTEYRAYKSANNVSDRNIKERVQASARQRRECGKTPEERAANVANSLKNISRHCRSPLDLDNLPDFSKR